MSIREPESHRSVSCDDRKSLAESVVDRLKLISRSSGENVYTVAIELISALRHVLPGDSEYYDQNILDTLDIFTPLWTCHPTGRYTREIQLDILSILVAYCSVFPFLQILITNSINNWTSLAQVDQLTIDQLLNKSSDNYEGDTSNIGFYTVVCMVSHVENFSLEALRNIEFNLGSVLLRAWLPLWLAFKEQKLDLENFLNADSDIFLLISTEAGLDFLIAIAHPRTFVLKSFGEGDDYSVKYFSGKISRRICLLKSWLDPQYYSCTYKTLMPQASFVEMEELDQMTATSGIRVLMEVLNHPEYNYIEEPHFCMLIYISLHEISKTPVCRLHTVLGQCAATQSLYAIINMVQFTLAAYIINIFNAFSRMSNETDFFNIPKWFTKTVLPPIPPLPRSVFEFGGDNPSGDESRGFLETIDLLLCCLELTIAINSRILKEYRQLGINPLNFNFNIGDSTKSILVREYMELYLIPLLTALVLSDGLRSENNILNKESNGQRGVADDNCTNRVSVASTETTDLINTPKDTNVSHNSTSFSKLGLHSRLLWYHLIDLCKNLLYIHQETALFHMFKFISRISVERLVLQRVSMRLLDELFFGAADKGSVQSLRDLCMRDKPSFSVLHSYIDLWNDGSPLYTKFFGEIFGEKQPKVGIVLTSIGDLTKLLPGEGKTETNASMAGTIEQLIANKCSEPSRESQLGIQSVQHSSGSYGQHEYQSRISKYNVSSPQLHPYSPVGVISRGSQSMRQTFEEYLPTYNPGNHGHQSIDLTGNTVVSKNNKFIGDNTQFMGSISTNSMGNNGSTNLYSNSLQSPYPQNEMHFFRADKPIGMGSANSPYCTTEGQLNTISPGVTSSPNFVGGSSNSLPPATFNQSMGVHAWITLPNSSTERRNSMKIVSTGKKYILGGDSSARCATNRSHLTHGGRYESRNSKSLM